MARYFFDVTTPDLIVDEEGAEFADLESAISEAEASAGELERDAELAGQDRGHWKIVIRDAAAGPLLELPVRDWAVMRDALP